MDKSGPKDNGWSKFEEYAKQREVVGGTSGLPGSRNPLSPTAGRLHKEDMAIYGREPATDKMILVVCELCRRVVKSQALLKHRELYHSNAIKSPPPPRRPPDHVPGGMGPIQTIGQSTSLGPTTVGSSKKSKECDLDRHCGVWIESDKRLCRKSITCKIHSLELRQKVRGRSKPFADLLHEYKRQKKIKKMQKRPGGVLPSSALLPPPLPPSPAPSSIVPSSPVGSSTSPVLHPPPPPLSTGAPASPLSSSLLVYLDESDTEEYGIATDVPQRQQLLSSSDPPPPGPPPSVLSEAQLYPKPGATNKFGSRFLSQGCLSFSRRADPLRYSLIALSEQEKEFIHTPDSTILRQCNHLSQQRHVVKKYLHIGRQNHVISSYTRRLDQPSPSTTTSSSSISLSTGITTDHTSTISTPTLDKWNQFSHSSSLNEIGTSTGHALTHQPTLNRKRSRASSSVISSGRGTLSTANSVNTINNIELGHSFDDNGDNDDDVERVKRPNLSRVKREEDKISPSKLIEQQQYLMKMGFTPPPTMNGIASSPVQPFPVIAGAHSPSTSSGATFVINPSHNILPRSMLPISGFGVPSPSTQSAFSPVVGGERGLAHFPSTTEPHQQLLGGPGGGGGQQQRHQLWVNSQHQQMMNYESNSYHHHPPHSHSPHSLLSHHPASDSLSNNNTNDHLIDYQSPSLPHMNKFSLPPPAGVPPSQQQSQGLAHQLVPGSLPPPLNPVGGVGINSTSPPRLHRLAPSGGSGGGGGGSQNHHSYHQSGLVASQNVTQRTQQVS
ncbi:PREDICTED: ataxin-7-like isoform X1 [Amphimedon queenslandica]|uniref:SCA7 domain-containing protein n=1 Tax=Amphimedon queenslandica TaxID=400682 RepID=A0AAN0IVF4_AMPQE|nr:PREDICTED: ataxin-7-like isoform X1 [Amphimedon queenslandica]|eukprot:XP_011410019.1 PREDICTED: ataxin-7-like isoform X1 [Amphimedon queenslandica]